MESYDHRFDLVKSADSTFSRLGIALGSKNTWEESFRDLHSVDNSKSCFGYLISVRHYYQILHERHANEWFGFENYCTRGNKYEQSSRGPFGRSTCRLVPQLLLPLWRTKRDLDCWESSSRRPSITTSLGAFLTSGANIIILYQVVEPFADIYSDARSRLSKGPLWKMSAAFILDVDSRGQDYRRDRRWKMSVAFILIKVLGRYHRRDRPGRCWLRS